MSDSLVSSPPRGLLRIALRLPVLLFRIGLGWLLGGRFLLLHHIGRKSGKAYRTVVEVVDHDQATDTYFIASGWGYKAQWYRNIVASPDINIQVGKRKLTVHAITVTPEVAAQILISYRADHPIAARELSNLMGIDIAHSSVPQLAETIRSRLPVIALHPR